MFFLFYGFCDSGLGAHGCKGVFPSVEAAQAAMLKTKAESNGQYDASWAHIADEKMQIVWEVFKEFEPDSPYLFDSKD